MSTALEAYFRFLDQRASSVYPVLWLRNEYPSLSRTEAVAIVEAWRAYNPAGGLKAIA